MFGSARCWGMLPFWECVNLVSKPEITEHSDDVGLDCKLKGLRSHGMRKRGQVRYGKIFTEFGRQEIIGYLGKSNYLSGGKKIEWEVREQR